MKKCYSSLPTGINYNFLGLCRDHICFFGSIYVIENTMILACMITEKRQPGDKQKCLAETTRSALLANRQQNQGINLRNIAFSY